MKIVFFSLQNYFFLSFWREKILLKIILLNFFFLNFNKMQWKMRFKKEDSRIRVITTRTTKALFAQQWIYCIWSCSPFHIVLYVCADSIQPTKRKLSREDDMRRMRSGLSEKKKANKKKEYNNNNDERTTMSHSTAQQSSVNSLLPTIFLTHTMLSIRPLPSHSAQCFAHEKQQWNGIMWIITFPNKQYSFSPLTSRFSSRFFFLCCWCSGASVSA